MNKMKSFYIFSVFLVVCFLSSLYLLFGNMSSKTNANEASVVVNNVNNNVASNVAKVEPVQAVNMAPPLVQKKDIFKACYALTTTLDNSSGINNSLNKLSDVNKKVSQGDERAIVYFDLGQDKTQATNTFNQYQEAIFKGNAMEQDNGSYFVQVATLASYDTAKQQVDGLNSAMNGKGINGTWKAKNITKVTYSLTANSAQAETSLVDLLKNQGKLNKTSCN